MLICKICGKNIEEVGSTICVQDNVDYPVHIECAETFLQHCDHCNKFFKKEELKLTSLGNHYCPTCLDSLTVKCDVCGRNMENDVLKKIYGKSYCQSCFEGKYTFCVVCGKRILKDKAKNINGANYCNSCSKKIKKVENYSYKPSPIFFGEDSSRYFGIEVETEYKESNIYANEIIGNSNIFYAKHDGSLNNGIEFVSHPCTLDFWRNESKLNEFCNRAISLGFKSHNTSSCGLHVHITKSTVSRETFEKVLVFISNNWHNVVKFTRRKSDSINRWAKNNLSRYSLQTKTTAEKMKLVKEYEGGSRYVAVNETSSTYEFRIFRGTLNYNTILACIEFCDAVIELCKSCTFAEVDKANFKTLMYFAGSEKYKEMQKFWVARNK